MVHQNAHYLKLKGSTYYYTRRVPKSLQKYASVNRVEVCLHTKHESSALRQSRLLSAELEEQWAILRRKEATSCLLRCSGVEKVGAGSRQKQAENSAIYAVLAHLKARLQIWNTNARAVTDGFGHGVRDGNGNIVINAS